MSEKGRLLPSGKDHDSRPIKYATHSKPCRNSEMAIRLPQPLLTAASWTMLHAPASAQPLFAGAMRLLGMPNSARFVRFAMDFEAALHSDDWQAVEQHFAPDACYEVRNMGPAPERMEGRGEIIRGFRRSLDGFDRQLERKVRVVEGPVEQGDCVRFVWVGDYRRAGAPPLVISARQCVRFKAGLIVELVDDYLPGYGEAAGAWLAEHGEGLNPSYLA